MFGGKSRVERDKIMKKIISIIFTGALAVSICAATAGCGEKISNTAETTMPAATTQAAESSQNQTSQASTDNTEPTAVSGSQPSTSQSSGQSGPGITEEEAKQKALQEKSNEYKVSNCALASDESGNSVWAVTLQSDKDPLVYVYYVRQDKCILAYADDKKE